MTNVVYDWRNELDNLKAVDVLSMPIKQVEKLIIESQCNSARGNCNEACDNGC